MTGSKIKLWINAFLPPVAWAGLIFILSSQQVLPGLKVSGFDFFFKKFAHMFVYSVLYILLYRGVDLIADKKSDPKVRIFLPIILVIGYAISDEIHQSFVPNRYATLRDVGYDILGSSLVILKKYKYI
jgi:VanZ family protein